MPALVSAAQRADAILPALPRSVWRADQLASGPSAMLSSGHAELDPQLPGGGWPLSTLIELLSAQAGIGEMRLLLPALQSIARARRIVLLQPPHAPQIAAWNAWRLPAERLLWLRPANAADALWCAEQVLRSGSCGALLFWQAQSRPEALRRLHLAAQGSEILFWMLRPLAAAQDASPAPLRLALRPAGGALLVDIVKRRGPRRDEPLRLALPGDAPFPISSVSRHAYLDRRAPAAAAARSDPALLA